MELSVVNCISASEFKKLVQSGKHIDLIDVRTPAEFASVHVSIARNEPLDRLNPNAIQSARNGTVSEPLYVICRSGARGKQACEKLLLAGIRNAINVSGGTLACESIGLSVTKGKKSIPLNCQVQIVSGLLILFGSALAYWVYPYWAALPAMMGLGLIYSGITDTCAVGMILAQMPWNQVSSDSAPTAIESKTQTCSENKSGCCN